MLPTASAPTSSGSARRRRAVAAALSCLLTGCDRARADEITIDGQDPSPPTLTLRVGIAFNAAMTVSSPGTASEISLHEANSRLAVSAWAIDSGSGVQAVQIFLVETRMSCVAPAGAPLQVCTPSTIADSLERPAFDSVVPPKGAGGFAKPTTLLTRTLDLKDAYPPPTLGPGDSVRQTLSFFGAAKNHAGKEARSGELRVTWVTRGP